MGIYDKGCELAKAHSLSRQESFVICLARESSATVMECIDILQTRERQIYWSHLERDFQRFAHGRHSLLACQGATLIGISQEVSSDKNINLRILIGNNFRKREIIMNLTKNIILTMIIISISSYAAKYSLSMEELDPLTNNRKYGQSVGKAAIREQIEHLHHERSRLILGFDKLTQELKGLKKEEKDLRKKMEKQNNDKKIKKLQQEVQQKEFNSIILDLTRKEALSTQIYNQIIVVDQKIEGCKKDKKFLTSQTPRGPKVLKDSKGKEITYF